VEVFLEKVATKIQERINEASPSSAIPVMSSLSGQS